MLVVIEGNTATGKTSLAKALSSFYNLQCYLEPSGEVLEDFYRDFKVSPLKVQLNFLIFRLHIQNFINKIVMTQNIVTDFLLIKDFIYAKMFLSWEDFKIYRKLYCEIQSLSVKPDILIYLHAPISFLLNRIKNRNRPFEGHIDKTFLRKLDHLCRVNILRRFNGKIYILNSQKFDIIRKPKSIHKIANDIELDKILGNQN